jgi:arylsulfatase A-like enzyme
MTAKTAFIILLRIMLVLSSLQFIRDAFFKWDGYSYYMRFMEFLPDLSLTYIFLGIFIAIFAIVLWLGIYLFNKLLPSSLKIGLEHILTWLILSVLLLVFKKVFFKGVSLTELFGLNYFLILIIGGILTAGIVWILHEHNEKILNGLNSRITPLVWTFVLLLIVAVPFSFTGGRSHDEIETTEITQDTEKGAVKEPGTKRPNIVLVVMDSLTVRDMGLYGYGRQTTPFITEWAKKSIVYTRAYSSSNWTTPAMMSMLTGQRPWTHKVWYRAYFNPVHNYKNNLPGILKDYGYNVYGFVQNHYAHPDVLGIGKHFMTKAESHTLSFPSESLQSNVKRWFVDRPIFAEWVLNVHPVINALINQTRQAVNVTVVPPDAVYNQFLNFMKDSQEKGVDRDKPFFALLHVFPPHTWYLPPEPFIGIFGDDSKYRTDIEQEKITNREYPPEMQAEVDILRKRYDEFILYSDKQFELFISRLDEVIDMSNTIIILTSDHGESFSHGYQEHDGPYLFEQFVHVPLIMHLSGKTDSVEVDALIEQIDIAPTILEFAGISVPEWMEGRSFLPFIEGNSLNQQPIYSMQLIKNRSFGHLLEKGTIAVWDESYKLIYSLEDKKTLLFDLQADPFETKDISQEKHETAQKLLTFISDNLSSANARIAQHKN